MKKTKTKTDNPINMLIEHLGLGPELSELLAGELLAGNVTENEVQSLAVLAKTQPSYRKKLHAMLTQYDLKQVLLVYHLAGVLPTRSNSEATNEKYYHFFADELGQPFARGLGQLLKEP